MWRERPGERHVDRGKSSLACKPGSKIGEPEERESVHAMSDQVKLRGAITGRQNRAFFGRSGCRILNTGGVMPGSWQIWQNHHDPRGWRYDLHTVYGSAGSVFDNDGASVPRSDFSDISRVEIGPLGSVLRDAGRHHYRCRVQCVQESASLRLGLCAVEKRKARRR